MEFAIPRNVHTLLPDILFNAQLQIWSIAVQTPPPMYCTYEQAVFRTPQDTFSPVLSDHWEYIRVFIYTHESVYSSLLVYEKFENAPTRSLEQGVNEQPQEIGNLFHSWCEYRTPTRTEQPIVGSSVYEILCGFSSALDTRTNTHNKTFASRITHAILHFRESEWSCYFEFDRKIFPS